MDGEWKSTTRSLMLSCEIFVETFHKAELEALTRDRSVALSKASERPRRCGKLSVDHMVGYYR